MIVLVGETRDAAYLKVMQEHGWGRIWVRSRPVQYEGEPWAFDNGAYGYFLKGQPLDESAFMRRLERAAEVCAAPTFAVIPDIVGDGARSLDYSQEWIERLASHPWGQWYFVVQDGMTTEHIAPLVAIPLITGLFLGGSDRFKQTASYWSEFAHLVGLKFHYGRASTPAKIRAARRGGADSMDTAFPLWTRERFQRFVDMWSKPDPQPSLYPEFAVCRTCGGRGYNPVSEGSKFNRICLECRGM